MVHAIFLLIDASLGSGVPKREAECWALRPMGECIHILDNKPKNYSQSATSLTGQFTDIFTQKMTEHWDYTTALQVIL